SGTTTFRDSIALSGAKSFTLWDYFDRINAVVLFATDGDQTGFSLLQRANGKQYRMPSDPLLSPDRQRLVTVDICAKICTARVAGLRPSGAPPPICFRAMACLSRRRRSIGRASSDGLRRSCSRSD